MAEETEDERAAFDAAYERIKAELEEKIRINRESERLTAKDYAVVINCTDEDTKEAVRNRPPFFHVEV